MPSRTKPERSQIEVEPAVKAALNEYKSALQSGFSRRTSTSDLIGALLVGVPLWQAEAMLQAYRSQDMSWEDPGDSED